MKINIPIRRSATINMVPLIDSMFLLLVFFIYAMMAMAIQKGLPVTLPNASAAIMPPKDITTISIDHIGQFAINDLLSSENDLVTHISQLKRQGKAPNILIRADERATHGRVITVLNILQANSIDNVSFQTNGGAQQ